MMETFYIPVVIIVYLLMGLGTVPLCEPWENETPLGKVTWLLFFPIFILICGIVKAVTGKSATFK